MNPTVIIATTIYTYLSPRPCTTCLISFLSLPISTISAVNDGRALGKFHNTEEAE